MSSIFTKIINRQIPALIVYEDDQVIAFLDQFPLQLGHVLIVCKAEIDNWLDVSAQDYLAIHQVAQKIGLAISKSVKQTQGFQRIGQMVDGRAVPHFHLHLIPLFEGQEITHNEKIRLTFSPDQMQAIQAKIIGNLEK
jgi:histidine triad (HIT) family protein